MLDHVSRWVGYFHERGYEMLLLAFESIDGCLVPAWRPVTARDETLREQREIMRNDPVRRRIVPPAKRLSMENAARGPYPQP